MKHSNHEIKIQRCADGELSSEERAEFLSYLEKKGHAEDWRELALSFVENQVFSGVFDRVEESSSRPLPETQRQSIWSRRFHSNTAVAASLVVGAFVGVLTHSQLQNDSLDSQSFDQQVAAVSAQADSQSPSQVFGLEHSAATIPTHLSADQVGHPAFQRNALPATLVGNHLLRPNFGGLPQTFVQQQPVAPPVKSPAPVMQVNLASLNSDSPSTRLPVYSRAHWPAVQNQVQSTNFSPQLQKAVQDEGLQLNREVRWYRARMSDGREVYVPTERTRVFPAIQ